MYRYKAINIQLFVLLGMACFILVLNFILFRNYRDSKGQIECGYNEKLISEYEIIMDVYSDLSDLIYKSQINTPEVKQLFALGIRSGDLQEKNNFRMELYQELSGIYEMILDYNFRQLHFHEFDNVSYLRFHRLEKFGDDLTGIRSSVDFVNTWNEPISGFEEGRIFNGYRFVYPMNLEGEHLGSVEVSVSMKTVVDQLNQRFNQKTQFIILKEQVENKVFDSELSNYIPWPVDENFLLDKAISSECILEGFTSENVRKEIQSVLIDHKGYSKPFSVALRQGYDHIFLTFLPISNFENEQVAYIFTLSEGEDIRQLNQSFYLVTALMFLLFIFILSFAFYYCNSRKKMEILATIDTLTKSYVRREIMNQIKSRCVNYQRYKTSFSLIMLDIDHFKKVNDTFGHSVGDIVLAGISQIILSNIRNTDSLGRYGGEEFLILLPETSKDKACFVAEKIRRVVSEHNFHKVGRVTISLGVSEINESIESVEQLIIDVDNKLYKAKDEGRNRVVS